MPRKKRLSVHNGRVRPAVHIGPQRSSISLDPVVWEAFGEIAAHLGKTETQLIAEINQTRGGRGSVKGLSVAIRRYVVEFYRSRIKLAPRR